nr:unnamed protein product [Callosobruchus chinensis]
MFGRSFRGYRFVCHPRGVDYHHAK